MNEYACEVRDQLILTYPEWRQCESPNLIDPSDLLVEVPAPPASQVRLLRLFTESGEVFVSLADVTGAIPVESAFGDWLTFIKYPLGDRARFANFTRGGKWVAGQLLVDDNRPGPVSADADVAIVSWTGSRDERLCVTAYPIPSNGAEATPESVFVASAVYLHEVRWSMPGRPVDGEYRYLGREADFRRDVLEQELSSLFGDGQVYVVSSPRNTKFVGVRDALQMVANPWEGNNLAIWDEGFNTVLEVHHMGVFRFGVRDQAQD